MRHAPLSLILLAVSVFATAESRPILGAKVTNVELASSGKSIVTILNTSGRDISGYTIKLTAHFRDGHTQLGQRTEDYGPLTGEALRPGEVSQQTKEYGPDVVRVEAEIVVAIYSDQTAEVNDERAFKETVATRESIAQAEQLSADALKSASTDLEPALSAQHAMQAALQDSKTGRTTANTVFLQAVADLMTKAPVGTERDFVQQHADRLQHEATMFARYAQIRRQP